MWNLDLPDLGALTPTEQLWVIAQAVEENGGPHDYAVRLRHLADRLQEWGWWLAEPSSREGNTEDKLSLTKGFPWSLREELFKSFPKSLPVTVPMSWGVGDRGTADSEWPGS